MKTLRMFQQTRVPILGIVENMSYYICPHCDSRDYIFGEGGGKRAADRTGNSVLRRSAAGPGDPNAVRYRQSRSWSRMPDAPSSKVLREIAQKVAQQVSIRSFEAPVLEVE